jgi:hypothetical protein
MRRFMVKIKSALIFNCAAFWKRETADGSLWQSALNAGRAFHPSSRNRCRIDIPLFRRNKFAAQA